MSDGCDYMIPADRGTPPTRCGEPVTQILVCWDSGYGGRATYRRCAKHSGELYAVVRVSNEEACLKCCPTCTDTQACSVHCAAYNHPAGACRSSGATSTEGRLEAIRKRAEAVPPGPWEVAPHSMYWRSICLPAGNLLGGLVIGDVWPEVAEFVAGARDDIPWLVDQIQKHTTEKARLVDEFRRLADEAEKTSWNQAYERKYHWGLAVAYSTAAKMLEESKP